jgi:hypothetical protein
MVGKFGLGLLEGGLQVDWTDRCILGVKAVPGSRGKTAEREQPTVGRLSRVVPPPHARTVSGLLDELENGLQKVHVVLRERIHSVQGWQRVLFEAGIADQAATTDQFFCSMWQLSFLRYGRARVRVIDSSSQ